MVGRAGRTISRFAATASMSWIRSGVADRGRPRPITAPTRLRPWASSSGFSAGRIPACGRRSGSRRNGRARWSRAIRSLISSWRPGRVRRKRGAHRGDQPAAEHRAPREDRPGGCPDAFAIRRLRLEARERPAGPREGAGRRRAERAALPRRDLPWRPRVVPLRGAGGACPRHHAPAAVLRAGGIGTDAAGPRKRRATALTWSPAGSRPSRRAACRTSPASRLRS